MSTYVRENVMKKIPWSKPVTWKELSEAMKKAFRLELSLDPGLYGPDVCHFVRAGKREFLNNAKSRKNDGAVYQYRYGSPGGSTWARVIQVRVAQP